MAAASLLKPNHSSSSRSTTYSNSNNKRHTTIKTISCSSPSSTSTVTSTSKPRQQQQEQQHELALLGESETSSNGGCLSPAMETYPSSYAKFNTALNAGLLNPMSPPPHPIHNKLTRSSPTLFDMMANEQEYYHPRPPLAPPLPVPATTQVQFTANCSVHDRQLLLQERVAEILNECSSDPGGTADVRLTFTSMDGISVTVNVHRAVLVAHSRFFASRLSERVQRQQQRSVPGHIVEISDCDDVEAYAETLRLMYCPDIRRRLRREDVSKVLTILKVSAAISFDGGVLSCLEYLEAAPWAEDEDEKVAAVLAQLHLENSCAGEVLKRVSVDVIQESNSNMNNIKNGGGSGEDIIVRLLQVVLEGQDEKARREMKGVFAKMLRENINSNNSSDLSKESLYSACEDCLQVLRRHFLQAAAGELTESAQIARQSDNLHWILDILVDRQAAEDFLHIWAEQTELAAAHGQISAVHRYEISRVTARLFIGIGKGQILVSKEGRCLLLKTWLQPFYDDFGWMRRACKGLDRHLVEEGLGNTILTLPMALQQEILIDWFNRFLNSGDDCPNIQIGFEVWWRRALWRRNSEPERPPLPQLRIAATAPSDMC